MSAVLGRSDVVPQIPGSRVGDDIAPGSFRRQTFDVAVIGAGLAGLQIALDLARLGASVVVLERALRLGDGASTRNEGWLHAGTFHATSIVDDIEAAAVARRCMAGHEAFRRAAPEAVCADDDAFAIVSDELRDHAVTRWANCGVKAASATRTQLESISASVILASGDSVYQVGDVAIDSRKLFALFNRQLRDLGVPIHFGVDVICRDGDHLVAKTPSEGLRVQAGTVVVAAGYSSRPVLDRLGVDSPMFRYWLSHLCITPRLAPHAVFSIASGEAAMMAHGTKSITGLNQDATQVHEPSTRPTPTGAAVLAAAMAERFRGFNPTDAKITACTKVDLAFTPTDRRSLNVSVSRLCDGVIIALPGKMTETPVVARTVANMVFDGLPDTSRLIAERPMDVA